MKPKKKKSAALPAIVFVTDTKQLRSARSVAKQLGLSRGKKSSNFAPVKVSTNTPEMKDTVLSGGDPFALTDEQLYCARLAHEGYELLRYYKRYAGCKFASDRVPK